MGSLDNNGHTERLEGLLDAVSDLHGEPFLNLEPAGISVHNPRNLAEPGYVTVWYIGNVSLAVKRQEMMLAHGIELNVFYQNHLLIFFLEHGALENCHRVNLVTVHQELHAFGHPFRSFKETFPGWVFSQQTEYVLVMLRQFTGCFRREYFFFLVCHKTASFQTGHKVNNYIIFAIMEESKNKARILVIDDEEDICEILQYNLERAGYKVKTVLSAEDAMSEIAAQKYDLLLLDIMLGGISGLKLAKLLREDYKSSVPIIFVTALDTEDDILKGFRTGGDDYISKPFSVNEVIARVGAVLSRSGRRVQAEASSSSWKRADVGAPEPSPIPSEEIPQNVFDFGSLKVDATENHVIADGTEVFLTRKEMDILLLLARSAGKIFSREEILKKVWKDDGFVLQRTVDVHIARLRKKLGKAGELIQNRSGYGYCIQKPHSA